MFLESRYGYPLTLPYLHFLSAWAHLILYGEEATKKAQEEGQQAVAAYEQEQKDIAEGKIPIPPPKTKKKKTTTKGKTGTSSRGRKKGQTQSGLNNTSKSSLNCLSDVKPVYEKMSRGISRISSARLSTDENSLVMEVSSRILASRRQETIGSSYCVPVSKMASKFPTGCALLLGLSSVDVGWNMKSFFEWTQHIIEGNEGALQFALESEFGKGGINSRFRTVLKGFPCIIGKASKHLEEAASALGFYGTGLGGTVGDVDCNIGGIDGSCSERSAVIFYSQHDSSFYLKACGTGDVISVNGKKVEHSAESFQLRNKAVCSVGSRVFMFILASESMK